MKNFYKKIVSYVMMVLTFFSSLLTGFAPHNKVQQKEAEDFEPVLRFTVCSDTHVNLNAPGRIDRIKRVFSFAYKISEEDKNHPTLDGALFVGDVTDKGKEEQFDAFRKVIEEAKKDETKLLAVVAKSHDSTDNGKKSLKYISDITKENSDFHVVINGYHFIGISTSKYEGLRYGIYQKLWLEKQLAAAAKDDPQKPIFVCHHEHVKSTVYGSSYFEGWGVTNFRAIIKKYPQVVHFSGHSHYPLNDPRSIWQGDYTAVGTGAIAYMELTVDNDKTVHPEGYGDSGQAWLVEVDKDNQIRLRGFNETDGQFLCDYLITNPSDKSTFAYTPFNQIEHSSPPEFSSSAKLSVRKDGDKYIITAPQATSTDGKIVFLYRIEVKNEKGKTVFTQYKVNDYWRANPMEKVDFSFDGKDGFSAEIWAENAYGMKSEKLKTLIQ